MLGNNWILLSNLSIQFVNSCYSSVDSCWLMWISVNPPEVFHMLHSTSIVISRLSYPFELACSRPPTTRIWMFIWSDHGTTTSPSRAYPAMAAMGYVPFTERRRFCCMESLLLHDRQKETVAVYWLHPFSLWSLSWVCGHVVDHSSSLQKAKVDRFGNFYASCVDQFCIAAVHRTVKLLFCGFEAVFLFCKKRVD